LRDEVVFLAKKHGIATPYTSYLVVPDNAPMGGGRLGRMPEGGRTTFGIDSLGDGTRERGVTFGRQLDEPANIPMPAAKPSGATSGFGGGGGLGGGGADRNGGVRGGLSDTDSYAEAQQGSGNARKKAAARSEAKSQTASVDDLMKRIEALDEKDAK